MKRFISILCVFFLLVGCTSKKKEETTKKETITFSGDSITVKDTKELKAALKQKYGLTFKKTKNVKTNLTLKSVRGSKDNIYKVHIRYVKSTHKLDFYNVEWRQSNGGSEEEFLEMAALFISKENKDEIEKVTVSDYKSGVKIGQYEYAYMNSKGRSIISVKPKEVTESDNS